MHVERHSVALATNGSGAATGYTPVVTGRVLSIQYVKTDFADGVTFAVTAEATGETIWSEAAVNASAVRRPRAPTHATTGAAALYAAGGAAVNEPIAVASDRIKIVVSSGGDTKTGTVVVTVG